MGRGTGLGTRLPAGDGEPNLSARVRADLRRRLRDGEWPAGARLPGEHHLAAEYGVSRATIRSALRALASEGLTTTRHGSGTYATGSMPDIHADLRYLDSMTATIERVGATPGMDYRRREVVPADATQAAKLDMALGTPVLVTERVLTADGRPVAFSYDVIRRDLLPADLDVGSIEGSLYRFFARVGVDIAWAVAEVHAVAGPEIGWGRRPRDAVYVMLDQVHRTVTDVPVAWSRTYYPEGRFRFSLIRTR
jgi:GntR family transcriptional regulator